MEMENKAFYQECSAALERLVGLECWGVVAGKGTGSQVLLGFGAKIPWDKPVKNPCLTEDERNFSGEFSLFIQQASWRVEDAAAVICAWEDDNAEGAAMKRGLERLRGQKVASVALSFPGFDIDMRFENGVRLAVFSTFAGDKNYDNWDFSVPECVYNVGERSRVYRCGHDEIGGLDD